MPTGRWPRRAMPARRFSAVVVLPTPPFWLKTAMIAIAPSIPRLRGDAAGVSGMPRAVRQASWNITTAKPVSHNARVIGWWYDDAGQPTNWPAMLLSDRGAYFSHVFLTDDYEKKTQLLAAILGRLATPLWREIAGTALRRAQTVGHCGELGELMTFLQGVQSPDARKLQQSGVEELTAAEVNILSDSVEGTTGKVRYRQKEEKCSYSVKDNILNVEFNENIDAITPGQSIVLYSQDRVVGGGIIENSSL